MVKADPEAIIEIRDLYHKIPHFTMDFNILLSIPVIKPNSQKNIRWLVAILSSSCLLSWNICRYRAVSRHLLQSIELLSHVACEHYVDGIPIDYITGLKIETSLLKIIIQSEDFAD